MAAKVALKKVVQLTELPAVGTSKIASKLSIFDGDMASLQIQCVVNDVEPDFSHPRAITNVLNYAGGHRLVNDYNRLKKCPVGDAVIGRGFDLPCDWVIHTATPKVAYGRIHASEEDQIQLKSCYSSVLSLCKEKGISTIAFPSLGTRAHRYPLEEATKVGVMTILNTLKEDEHFERIVLCTHMGKDSTVVRKVVEECLKDME